MDQKSRWFHIATENTRCGQFSCTTLPECRWYRSTTTTWLFELNRVAMGLKNSSPFFQRSLSNKVLEYAIHIDDVLIHGPTDNEYLGNTPKVLERPRKEGRHPSKDKTRSQGGWICWTPDMQHRYLIHRREASTICWLPASRNCEGTSAVHWTGELLPRPCPEYDWDGSAPKKVDGHKEVIHFWRVAVSNCQELYFLEDSATHWCIRLWYWWLHVHDSESSGTSHPILQQVSCRIANEQVCSRERFLWHLLWR